MNMPNTRKGNVEVNDVSGGAATRIFYYLISAGKALWDMKKVLGDIVGGFPSENTPLMPRVLPRRRTHRLHSATVPRAGGRPPRAVTLLFVMNGFTRPQVPIASMSVVMICCRKQRTSSPLILMSVRSLNATLIFLQSSRSIGRIMHN